MEEYFKDKENPLKDYLDETRTSQEPIIISAGVSNTPGIPYNGMIIPIHRNFLSGTEYISGSYKPTQNRLSNIVANSATQLNNIVEILSFLIINQLPTISRTQKEKTKGESKKMQILFEQNLQKQIEQLEVNRKDLQNTVKSIERLAEEQYTTLYKHQETILNILVEKPATDVKEEIKNLKQEIKDLKNSLEKNEESSIKTIDELKVVMKELKQGVSELSDKL